MDNIDKKIEREDKRLADKKRRLNLEFARLDARLGKYEKLGGALKSQIAKLSGL